MEPRLQAISWEALPPGWPDAIGRVLSGRPAERELDRFLRGLCSDARAAAAEAVFGVALWRRRLRWDAHGSDAPRELLFVFLRDFAGVAAERAARICGLVAPLQRREGAPEQFADSWSFPDWIAATLLRDLGDDAAAFAKAVAHPGPICLRANPLRASRERVADALRPEGIETVLAPRARDGLVVTSPRPNLLATRAFRDGWFEVQDEGSQLVAEMVGARPGETVLDVCAGAGGKTLALAAHLRNEGRLVAWDTDVERLSRLRQRAQRAGARIEVLAEAPERTACAAVLVDAPCSELGTLRRGPDVRWLLREEDARAFPAQQLDILERALGNVRPGGRLVYATCTVRREENEGVARAFERAHPRLHRDSMLTLFPHRDATDGFFAVRWTNRGHHT
jgi:16S rRNA (cytosine967-C5)-methyltransferase